MKSDLLSLLLAANSKLHELAYVARREGKPDLAAECEAMGMLVASWMRSAAKEVEVVQ